MPKTTDDINRVSDLYRQMAEASQSGDNYALKNLRDSLPNDPMLHDAIGPAEHHEFGQWMGRKYGPLGLGASAMFAPAYYAGKQVHRAPEYTAGGRLMDYLAGKVAGGRSEPSMAQVGGNIQGAYEGMLESDSMQKLLDLIAPRAYAGDEEEVKKFEKDRSGRVKREGVMDYLGDALMDLWDGPTLAQLSGRK